jgi:hypothetical protein
MNENENLVTEMVAENVETTPTEETVVEQPKKYSEEEFNLKLDEVLGKKLARKEAKLKREYEKKFEGYNELKEVLKAGTGKENVSEITSTFREFYKQKGLTVPEKPSYTEKDLVVLARAEANDIINLGYEDVVEEVDRLARIGVANMTSREKEVFKILAEHRQNTERQNELSGIGISEEEYNSKEFKEFASKFNSNTPIKDVYDIYNKTKPKKEFKTMGSVKNTQSTDNGVKDFYTPEEARKFSIDELNKNPALYKAIENSMRKWK